MAKARSAGHDRAQGPQGIHGRGHEAPAAPQALRVAIRVYVDSDVLVWHLRGERKAAALLRSLAAAPGIELWTGAIQRAEIVFFMRTGEETATMSLLSQLRTAPLTQGIVDAAGALYRRWHPSHGTDVNDALLAATVASSGGRIVTRNVKHYPMPDVNVQKGW